MGLSCKPTICLRLGVAPRNAWTPARRLNGEASTDEAATSARQAAKLLLPPRRHSLNPRSDGLHRNNDPREATNVGADVYSPLAMNGCAAHTMERPIDERRQRRRLRREKQRAGNLSRASKMHLAHRNKAKKDPAAVRHGPQASVYVGCSGWRYWKWRDSFYAGVPQPAWFERYLKDFAETFLINWPLCD